MTKAPKLRITADPASPPPPAHKPDPIAAWLDTLSLFLKLPTRDRDNIRDELRGHLEERVRDLILSGTPEAQASQLALSELGDAVKLAHKLRAASRSPARRLVMNISVFAIAGAALVTSFVALRGGPDRPAPAIMPQPAARAPEQIEKIKLTAGPGATWGDLLKQVSDKAGMPTEIRWRALCDMGIGPGEPIHVEMKDQPLPGAFKFIADETGQPNNDLDYRVLDGRLIIATTGFFDQQETVLVAYDLSEQARQRAASDGTSVPVAAAAVTTEFREVIQRMVHSDGWQDNGGIFASTAVFGPKLFIKAPKRYHTEIQWVMDQLPKGSERDQSSLKLDRFNSARVEADVSVPVLSDVPLLNRQFKSTVPVDPSVDPITIKGENGARVSLTGPNTNMKADVVRIQPPEGQTKQAEADRQADLRARLHDLQREAAWKRAALGAQLSDEDKAAMDDNRAVKQLDPSDPHRADVMAELQRLEDQIALVKAMMSQPAKP